MLPHFKDTFVTGLIALAFLVPCAAHAYTYKVLHAFQADGSDGIYPEGSPIVGRNGDIYGTTSMGGDVGCGVVFKYSPSTGKYRIVHDFEGYEQNDGCHIVGGVIQDPKGNLIGASELGGTYGARYSGGTIFMIAPDGTETILHSFYILDGLHDGNGPYTGPILGPDGKLYGVTPAGGKYTGGVIYRLGAGGEFKLLYSFRAQRDSGDPTGVPVFGDDGYLYGTAPETTKQSFGIVFRIPAQRSRLTVVYAFVPHSKGGNPEAGLIKDPKGNFYGTTNTGGDYNLGTVFKVTRDGRERVLHSFTGADGANPAYGNLVEDADGNLYGTTFDGGEALNSKAGGGVVFQLTPDGTLNVLHSFDCDTDACNPFGGLALDDHGNIYGTAEQSNNTNNSGNFFELVK